MSLIKHYSPYLDRNFLYIRVWKWFKVFQFKPLAWLKPCPDLVEEYV